MKIDFKTRFGIRVHVDQHTDTKPVLAKYKGKTVFDTASYYAPYVPLQIVNAMEPNRIAAQGQLWGWTTFIVNGDSAEVVEWCQENFGKRHRGIYLAGFDLWLGNFGRWRLEHRQMESVGLVPMHVRIWLHREDDIALFKLRWG